MSGLCVTWDSFNLHIRDSGIGGNYFPAIDLIKKYKGQTLKKLDIFQEEVLDKNYNEDEANIILSTCHCAKGAEWNNVFVCHDFLINFKALMRSSDVNYKKKRSPNSMGNLSPIVTRKKARESRWLFDLDPSGDEINLLYGE